MIPKPLIAFAAMSVATMAAAADRPSVAPPPAWVVAATIPPPPPATESVAATALLVDEQSRLTDDGDAAYVETAIRIGSSQGLGAAALALAWDPALETLVIHRYRVLRDGKAIDLLGDGAKLTVVRRETNLERATLDGQLTATFQPDDIRVGDVVDIAFTRTRHDPALAGHSQQVFAVPAGAPIGHLRARLVWPAAKPVRWRAGPGVYTPKEERHGGDRELIAEATNVTPPRGPRGAPVRLQAVNYLAAADMGSWRDVAKLMAPLYAKVAALPADGALRAEAARIAAASPDPGARALAALRLVQDQVRYVLLAMDDGGYVPAAAELTWSRRFGDCKGKTVLLLALLRELGIDARPALVSTTSGDGLDARLPMIGAFDHVLVMATIGGRTYWLDGTRPGDRALDQIRTPEFHWALPLTAAGSDLVPLVPDALTRPQIVTTLDLDASKGIDVPAKATGELRFEGDAALGLRVALAQLPPEQRDRRLRDYWHEHYDFVTADTAAMIDEPATGTLRLTMTGTAVMDWSRYNGRRWYALDGGRVGFHLDTARDPGPNRDAPFAVDFPSWTESRQTILLPNGGAGFTVDGGDVDRTISVFAIHRSVKLTGNKLTMVASTRATGPEIPFAEVEAAKTALAALGERDVSVGASASYRPTDADVAALKATTPASVDALLDRGDILLDREDYADALHDADAAIAQKPDDPRVHTLRALALAWQKDPRFAAAADRALALDPKAYAAWHARAIFAFMAGRHAEAEAALTHALAIEPDDRWGLTQRARQRVALGHADEAVADAEALLKLTPDDPDIRRLHVDLLYEAGHRDAAVAAADRMVTAFPDNVQLATNRATLFAALGRKSEAVAAIDALVAGHPTDDEIRYTRAMLRKRFGDRDGALADFAAIFARGPHADMLVDRAQVWPIADRTHWSADLDEAAKLGAPAATVLKTRALLEAKAGDYAAATTTLAAAEHAAPDDPQIVDIRIDLLRRAGKKEEAITILETRIRAGTPSGSALNSLCWAKATLNVRLASAVADCDAALRLQPNNAAYLDSRAFAHFRLGETEAALADYDAALAARPEQAASLYGRALVKTKLGRDAAADFAAARAANPRVDAEFAGYGIVAPRPATQPAGPAAVILPPGGDAVHATVATADPG